MLDGVGIDSVTDRTAGGDGGLTPMVGPVNDDDAADAVVDDVATIRQNSAHSVWKS
jgi:hypothetical protein